MTLAVKQARSERRSVTRRKVILAKDRGEIAQNVQTTRQTRRRKGINKLLQNIYGKPRLLSNILRDGGLSENEVERLRRNYMNEYLTLLVLRWENWWRKHLSPREKEILGPRFCLKGKPKPSIETLAKKQDVAPNVVKWSEASAVRRLQDDVRKSEFEEIVLQAGREILSR